MEDQYKREFEECLRDRERWDKERQEIHDLNQRLIQENKSKWFWQKKSFEEMRDIVTGNWKTLRQPLPLPQLPILRSKTLL